jgi:hypothetical protein
VKFVALPRVLKMEASSKAKERNSGYIMDGSSVEIQVPFAGGSVVFMAQPGDEIAEVSPVEERTR